MRSLRGSLFSEGLQSFLEVFRGFSEIFQRFSEGFQWFLEVFSSEILQRFSEVLLRDPLRGRFPSQRLSVLLPLIVLPLELSPNAPRLKTQKSDSKMTLP